MIGESNARNPADTDCVCVFVDGGKEPMNRKQRMMQSFRAIASKAVDANLEYSTTFTLAGCILAINAAVEDSDDEIHFDYETWFKAFAEIYPNVLRDPEGYVKKAEQIAGVEIEIHWTK